MDHGGSVGGVGRHQEEHNEFRRFVERHYGNEHLNKDPFVRFNEASFNRFEPGRDPFGQSTHDHDPSNAIAGNERSKSLAVDSLSGSHGREVLTISATHGRFDGGVGDRSYFISPDGFHTIGASSAEHAATYFGYGVSVSASSGNTSLHGFGKDDDRFRDAATGSTSIHGAFAPSAIGSGWQKFDDRHEFGPSVSAYNQEYGKITHAGVSLTLKDGTKITFGDYKGFDPNKHS